MSYGDRIKTLQEQGRLIPMPPDNAYFGGLPVGNKLPDLTEDDRTFIDAVDNSTKEGRFERMRRASEIAIKRYAVGQLEQQDNTEYVEHLQRLIIAEIDFITGMRNYFKPHVLDEQATGHDTAKQHHVGRILVPNACFVSEYYEIKNLE